MTNLGPVEVRPGPWPYLIALLAGGALTYLVFCVQRPGKPVPQIVTVYNTVHDTVRLEGPSIVTTDTLQIVEQVTLHDTVQILIPADTARRPMLWPVLNVQVGRSRGDTTTSTTFSLRSGRSVVSRIWTPGPLKSLWADSSGTPRMDFYPSVEPKGISAATKGLWAAIGFGVCKLAK